VSDSRIQRMAHKLRKDKVVVRSATVPDIGGMTSLLQELFNAEPDFAPNVRLQRQGLGNLIESDTATVLVAIVGQNIVGMCTLQPLISTAEGGTVGIIEDLVVTSSLRGSGVGGLLLTEIENIAQKQDMSRLQLLMDSENKQVNKFYTDYDWEQTQLMTMRKKFG
jgi:N-acetylglutamate synthase-like GNAT family acetyltransferase